MLLSFVLSLKSGSAGLKHLPALPSSQSGSPLLAANSLCPESELFKSLELLGRCDALEKKTVTFENIVCVLNREVERVSLTAEAYSRQHRLDQEQIETLSNKVCSAWAPCAEQSLLPAPFRVVSRAPPASRLSLNLKIALRYHL